MAASVSALERWKKQAGSRRADVIITLNRRIEYFDQRLLVLEVQASNDVLINELRSLKAAYQSAVALLQEEEE